MNAKTTQLTRADLEDILSGATLLGAGGGGPKGVGQQIIDSLCSKGTLPTLVSLDDLDGSAWGAVSAFAGSPDAASGGSFDWSPATKAFQDIAAWGQGQGKPMSYVIPVELGGGNTFIPLAVAASLSPPLPVVDCAGARRAVPGLPELSYAEAKVVVSPMVLASPTDQMSVIVSNAQVADNVLRSVVVGSGFGEEAGIALWPMTGATARASAVPATTSYAQGLGVAIRTAPSDGAVAAAIAYTNGFVLADGTVSAVTTTTEGGFDLTTIVVDTGGDQIRVFAQNENMIAYSSLRPSPIGMAPDLLAWMTPDGKTFSNADPELVVGGKAVLLGIPALPGARTPYFIQQFLDNLRAAGYGGPYVPIEELNPKR